MTIVSYRRAEVAQLPKGGGKFGKRGTLYFGKEKKETHGLKEGDRRGRNRGVGSRITTRKETTSPIIPSEGGKGDR